MGLQLGILPRVFDSVLSSGPPRSSKYVNADQGLQRRCRLAAAFRSADDADDPLRRGPAPGQQHLQPRPRRQTVPRLSFRTYFLRQGRAPRRTSPGGLLRPKLTRRRRKNLVNGAAAFQTWPKNYPDAARVTVVHQARRSVRRPRLRAGSRRSLRRPGRPVRPRVRPRLTTTPTSTPEFFGPRSARAPTCRLEGRRRACRRRELGRPRSGSRPHPSIDPRIALRPLRLHLRRNKAGPTTHSNQSNHRTN